MRFGRLTQGWDAVPAAAVATALSCALIAACGSPAVPPEKWAKSVCTALSPWRTEVATLTERAQTEINQTRTPEQTKQSLTALLSGAENASEQARKRVAEAGEPDVAGGKAASQRVITALTRARDAYGHTRSAIAELDPASPGPFYDSVERAFMRLKQEYSASVLDVETMGPPPLNQAFREVPECR